MTTHRLLAWAPWLLAVLAIGAMAAWLAILFTTPTQVTSPSCLEPLDRLEVLMPALNEEVEVTCDQ